MVRDRLSDCMDLVCRGRGARTMGLEHSLISPMMVSANHKFGGAVLIGAESTNGCRQRTVAFGNAANRSHSCSGTVDSKRAR
jgi:hypothetical protein